MDSVTYRHLRDEQHQNYLSHAQVREMKGGSSTVVTNIPLYLLHTPKRKISQLSMRNSTTYMRPRILSKEDHLDMSSLSLAIHNQQEMTQYQQGECEDSYANIRKQKNIITQRSRRLVNRTNESILKLQNQTTKITQTQNLGNTLTTNDSSSNSQEDKSVIEIIPSKKISYNSKLFKKKKKKIHSVSAIRANHQITSANSDDIQALNKQFLFDNQKPYISAQSWVIIDQTTGQLLIGKKEAERRQVASLTKIMTAYVVFDMISRLKINEHETLIRVLPSTAQLTGTTASLLANDILSVWELLYAMLLPSGNDAAQTLAIYFGLLVIKQNNLQNPQIQEAINNHISVLRNNENEDINDKTEDIELINKGLAEFYKMMNREAMIIGLKNSNFCSSHGMHHDFNYCSAHDVAIISYHCMKQAKFRQIVKTQRYNCESRTMIGYLYSWQNTNKLLEQGYSGIKTGITPTAGPCLAASVNKDEFKLIIVILCSKSMEQRWIEVPKLLQWATNKITKIKDSDLKPSLKRKLLNKLVHI